MSDPVADAIQELRSITRCLCEPAWTDRGKHAVECVAYCREEVDLLAIAVAERDEALGLLRELVAGADDSRCWNVPMLSKIRALVERPQ